MEEHRSWFSLIGYCLVTTVGAALVFAVIVAGGSVALASHEEVEQNQTPASVQNDASAEEHSDLATFTGMITDSYCGARHTRYLNLTPTQCAAACIREGAKYLLVDGDHVYSLRGGRKSLSKLLGTRAKISGTRQGTTIVVNSASPGL